MNSRLSLAELLTDIDARVHAVRVDHPDWQCAKGCDGCCRRLAAVPRLTAAEWDLLRDALAVLAAPVVGRIRRNMAALAEAKPTFSVVCPLLDPVSGACPVYAARPVACRTYGFYVQRELGLYCREIESRVAGGALVDVVWGNHDIIDQRLAGLGEVRALDEWFARSPSFFG
jgi:uncharacterized protein